MKLLSHFAHIAGACLPRFAVCCFGAASTLGAWDGAIAAQTPSDTLKVCISEDNPPQSRMQKNQASGLDVRLAQAVAALTGQKLQWVPFETEYEKESSLTHEVNAMLSAGVCDLASGFPLLKSDLGRPSRPTSRVPDHPGAKRKRERPFITLGELAPSQAYQAATLGVVLRPGQAPVTQLSDLQGRKVGAVTGTLSGTLVSLYRQGLLRPSMVSLSQREDPWQVLQTGRADALLMPTSAFDAYRLSHPDTPLQLANYQRPIGLNLGFVALASAPQGLLQAVNTVIAQSIQNGQIQRWAKEEGLSWHAPSQPDVSEGPSLQQWVTD